MLLLFMPTGPELQEQIDIIGEVSNGFINKLKPCVMEEEWIPAFRKRFGIRGTPTYVFLVRGNEKGRFLGLAEPGKLSDFVLQHLEPD